MEQPTGQATAKGISTKEGLKPNSNDYLAYLRARKLDEQAVRKSVGQTTFITSDEKMRRICEVVDQIANANVSVLICGESGTGKEVIARMIHEASNRKDKPFVAVNCAAVPGALLESELFGHEKGSFTGAHQRHTGKFEQANGGTLLLDEITETEPALQAKLLRALQEREIERIGGTGPIAVDTRIIATTNRDIGAAVKDGSFRQDLYYRLNVIKLVVPPLRERHRDIEALAESFLKQFSLQFNRPSVRFSYDAMAKLVKYPWPGNVRELQNTVQRAVLMSQNEVILPKDIPLTSLTTSDTTDWIKTLPLGRPMRDVERCFIIETLKYHNGNRTHAAKTLGISLRTLRNKINEFTAGGFEVPPPTTGKAL